MYLLYTSLYSFIILPTLAAIKNLEERFMSEMAELFI